MGGAASTLREGNPAHTADAIIAYIGDGSSGKAVTAMTSPGAAPFTEDTVKHATELLAPCRPSLAALPAPV